VIRCAATLLLAVIAVPAVARAQPPCRPVARVGGEPALVAAVVPLLEERGVVVGGASACGAVDAVLATHDGRVRVTILDPDGGSIERSADDAAGAATAIESWVRRDVSDPLLAVRDAPPPPRQAGDHEPPPAAVVSAAAPLAAAAPGAGRAIDLAAAAELGVTGDGAIWRGARVQGCVTVGRLCAGGLLRFADDTETRGDSADLLTSRMAFELAFLAELPLRAGRRVTVAPGVRAGILSVTAERELLHVETEDETYAAHAGAGVASSVQLSGAWSLRGDLSVGWSPFPRTALGDRDRSGANEADPRLAGAEHLHAWLGLGVAYGGL
jgi:hypothetical protein